MAGLGARLAVTPILPFAPVSMDFTGGFVKAVAASILCQLLAELHLILLLASCAIVCFFYALAYTCLHSRCLTVHRACLGARTPVILEWIAGTVNRAVRNVTAKLFFRLSTARRAAKGWSRVVAFPNSVVLPIARVGASHATTPQSPFTPLPKNGARVCVK